MQIEEVVVGCSVTGFAAVLMLITALGSSAPSAGYGQLLVSAPSGPDSFLKPHDTRRKALVSIELGRDRRAPAGTMHTTIAGTLVPGYAGLDGPHETM